MKTDAEARVRAALTELGSNVVTWKPPDDARNWKPADFLVWHALGLVSMPARSAMIEVKVVDQLTSFPLTELRKNQRAAIRQAARIRLPYWLVVWWRRRQPAEWTVSNASRLIRDLDTQYTPAGWPTSVPHQLLRSRYGIEAASDRVLPGVLSAALREEIG
jgi:hypothetical protein